MNKEQQAFAIQKSKTEEAANNYYLTADILPAINTAAGHNKGFISLPETFFDVCEKHKLTAAETVIILQHLFKTKDYVFHNEELQINSSETIKSSYDDLAEKGLLTYTYNEKGWRIVDLSNFVSELIYAADTNYLADAEQKTVVYTEREQAIQEYKEAYEQAAGEKAKISNNEYKKIKSLSKEQIQLLKFVPAYCAEKHIYTNQISYVFEKTQTRNPKFIRYDDFVSYCDVCCDAFAETKVETKTAEEKVDTKIEAAVVESAAEKVETVETKPEEKQTDEYATILAFFGDKKTEQKTEPMKAAEKQSCSASEAMNSIYSQI